MTGNSTQRNAKEGSNGVSPSFQNNEPGVPWKILRGSLAGATAKTCVYPLDRLKMIYQVKVSVVGRFHLRTLFQEFLQVVKTEGPLSLWKGNIASLAKTFPHSGIVFYSFDEYRSVLDTYMPQHTNTARFLAGGGAGITSAFLLYPLDVWNTRMAVSRGSYRYMQVTLLSYEGWRSLYRGLFPTLLGIFPYAGISFVTFEGLKQRLQGESRVPLTPLQAMFCGGIAGVASQTATYPLDTLRKFMQTNTFLFRYSEGGDLGPQHPGIVRTFRHIHRAQGFTGFFNGVSLNWIKGFVAAGISFMIHEYLKDLSRVD